MEHKRAWLYCRTAYPDAHALTVQQAQLEAFAEKRGFEIVGTTVNANQKMSIFAEMECHFSAVSATVYTALIHHFTCRLEARQALIYQLALGLTGENGKYNYSRAVHLYPPFFDITCSAKNYKIAPALTTTAEHASGLNFSRKGLAEVSCAVEAGGVDLLLVTNLSRLGRDVQKTDAYLRWLEDHFVDVICADGTIPQTCTEILHNLLKASGVHLGVAQ